MDVHRSSLFDFAPKAIRCLAIDSSKERLAIVRSDASIEIWGSAMGTLENSDGHWRQEIVIPGAEDEEITAVVWCRKRLITSGMNGQITEWDTKKLIPKARAKIIVCFLAKKSFQAIHDSFCGAVWAIEADHDDSRLAVGGEDGCIRLFDVNTPERGLDYQNTFPKQESRVLSLAWQLDDQCIYSGGAESVIYKWNVEQRQCLTRLTLDQYKEKTTRIWSLVCLSNSILVSGDSLGKVHFWNGSQGTLQTSFHIHQADVLALATDGRGRLFASGIDSKVIQLERLGGSKWVHTGSARCHSHDVQAMVLCGNSLLTGGLDTRLVIHNCRHGITKDSTISIPPYPHHSRVSIASKANLMLFQYSTHLHIWLLGSAKSQSEEDELDYEILAAPPPPPSRHPRVSLDEEPCLLLEIKSSSRHHILSSAISLDGKFAAFSDCHRTRVFALKRMKKTSRPSAVRIPHGYTSPSQNLAFVPETNWIIAAGTDSTIKILKIDSESVSVLKSIPNSPAHLLAVSQCGRFFAAGDCRRHLEVYNLESFDLISSVPVGTCLLTAIAFQPSKPVLVFCTGTNEINVFDFEREKFTSWSRKTREVGLPEQWRNHRAGITGISFHSDTNKMILWNHCFVCVVDLTKSPPPVKSDVFGKKLDGQPLAKKMRKTVENGCFKIFSQYQGVLFFGITRDSQGVMVEKRWNDIQKQLPPALFRIRYGT